MAPESERAKKQICTADVISGYADAKPDGDELSGAMELAIRERIRWQAAKREEVRGYNDKAEMRLTAYIGGLNWALERAGKAPEVAENSRQKFATRTA